MISSHDEGSCVRISDSRGTSTDMVLLSTVSLSVSSSISELVTSSELSEAPRVSSSVLPSFAVALSRCALAAAFRFLMCPSRHSCASSGEESLAGVFRSAAYRRFSDSCDLRLRLELNFMSAPFRTELLSHAYNVAPPTCGISHHQVCRQIR